MRSLVVVFLIFQTILLQGQDAYERQENIDIQRYIFELSLNDENNKIEGKAAFCTF